MNFEKWRKEYSEKCREVMSDRIGKFENKLSDTGRTASIEQVLFRLWGKESTAPCFAKLVGSKGSDSIDKWLNKNELNYYFTNDNTLE